MNQIFDKKTNVTYYTRPILLMTDIDNTLVYKGGEITQFTKDILNELHCFGVWFCIASGRPIDEVSRSVEDYQLDFDPEFIVGMNGGEIMDNINGKTIVQYLLSEDQLKTLVEIFDKQPCNITMYKNKRLYAKKMDELVAMSAQRAEKPPYIVQDLSELYDQPNAKLMYRTDSPEICDELLEFARSLNLPGIRFFKTQPDLLEVCDERVHKGAALEAICAAHNIPYEEVMAFGDASNDNEMLEKAGLGVCMADGLPDTKAIADVITEYPCKEDGLPLWLFDHGLTALDEDMEESKRQNKLI